MTLAAPVAAQDPAATAPGVPGWVTPGTKLSYKTAGATILSDGGTRLVEDPNGPLTDPATGTRYREEWTAGTPQGGTGFEGILEITVTAISGTDVIVSRGGYVRDQLSGGWLAGPSSAARVAGAQVDGAWWHPDQLATVTDAAAQGYRVLRGQVALGGRTIDAVTLVREMPGDYAAFWYDATTGQLVQSAIRSTGQNGTTMSTSELLGVRQLGIPGIGASAPDAIVRATGLMYSGAATIVNPMDPSQPGMSTPVQGEVTFTERGDTWTLQQTSAVAQSIGQPTVTMSATGGVGPYWWSPTALAGMTVGQVLDQDPWTGLTTTVSEVGQTSLGPAVAIRTSGNGLHGENHWDVGTGLMLVQINQSELSGITTQLQLDALP